MLLFPTSRTPRTDRLAREPDPRRRVQLAAALSRAVLERIAPVYALLRTAADTDDTLGEHLTAVFERRHRFPHHLVELICGDDLRAALSVEHAADTDSALAGPDRFLLLTTHQGWTAGRLQVWLASVRRSARDRALPRMVCATSSP